MLLKMEITQRKIYQVNFLFNQLKSSLLFIAFILSTISVNAQNIKDRCMNCHGKMVKFEYVHEVINEDCFNCHTYNNRAHPGPKGNEFTLTETVPDLCFICHESYSEKSFIHTPISEGDCASCHDPHASNYGNLLSASEEKICAECHDLNIPESDLVHAPVNEGNCSSCHDPHQSEFSALLKGEKKTLCFQCHENTKKEFDQEFTHVPVDDCANCHVHHSSPNKNLLAEKSPDLCYMCHESYEGENILSSHNIMNDEKSCSNCHSPHAANSSLLLYKEGKELCLDCHSQRLSISEKLIDNIGEKINTAKSIHPAVEMDGCVTCHKAHNSEYPFLLTANYPKGKYSGPSADNFALCFECHDTGLLRKEFSEDVTTFRDGNINLHYLHMKDKKARSCSLCHDMHASSNEHLINDFVQFGSWDMPMNYKKTHTGGSCFPGCHAEEKYKR